MTMRTYIYIFIRYALLLTVLPAFCQDGVGWPGSGETSGRYLFAGKEYSDFAGESQYDFGARTLATPTVPYFTHPDPHFLNMPTLSPYSYCGGNPVMNIDPTGKDICILHYGGGVGHIAMLIQDEKGKWRYYSVNGDKINNETNGKKGRPFNDKGEKSWNSPQDFINSEYNQEGAGDDLNINSFGYQIGYQITTSSSQDTAMRKEFVRLSNLQYGLTNENCATAVQKTLVKGGIAIVPTNLYILRGSPDGSFSYIGLWKVSEELEITPHSAFRSIISANPNGKWYEKSK